MVVTRAGKPVAELRPVRRPNLSAAEVLRRWRHLPALDPARLRAGIDATLDSTP
jgi:antitoxin (DNA-binding transcriptional repressor) of toxin-antitoxin stability system